MNLSIEVIIFYILLIDSIAANLLAWSGEGAWFNKNFRIISRYFPLTKGWTTYYLVLVIFIGFILYKYNAL